MNTFTKVGGNWGVRVFPTPAQTGDTVTVTTRAGVAKQVTLGALVRTDRFGQVFFTVAAPSAPRATEVVGDLSRIVAMFDRARQHLRFPAIVLDGFRVNVAGQRAREPGSLTVTSVDRTQYSTRFGGGEQRQYFGRVTRAGVFEPARGAPEGLGPKLRAFAADPAGEAARHGHLHGACCFCNRALTDERSTAVGYGPICADHFGLPWGAREVSAPVAAQAPVAVAAARREADARALSIASEEAMEQGSV